RRETAVKHRGPRDRGGPPRTAGRRRPSSRSEAVHARQRQGRRVGLEDFSLEASAVLRPQILELGIADERELDDLDSAVRAHLDDPGTVVMPGLMFLARGRKPGAP